MGSIEISMSIFKVQDGVAYVSSLDVAEYYGMRHDSLLRTIENKLLTLPELRNHNILVSYYKLDSNTKSYKCYLLDRRGFLTISMGLTGGKAARAQLALVDAFEEFEGILKSKDNKARELEEELKEAKRKLARVEGKKERVNLTAAIKSCCIDNDINYGALTNEEYKAIYNKNAAELRELLSKIIGKPKSKINLREYFSEFDLSVIGHVENITTVLLDGERGLTIAQIKRAIRDAGELILKNKNRGNFLEPVFEQKPAKKLALEGKKKAPNLLKDGVQMKML